MTTATAPAPLTDGAFLGLVFGDTELAERPGELFDTYFVRKISAEALVEAIDTVAAKMVKKLPGLVVTAYVDDYTGPAVVWCEEHRSFADADRTLCREVAWRAQHEYVPPCHMHPAQAATVEVRVEGLPMWGEWGVGAVLTRDTNGAVVATSVGAQRDDETFAHRYSHLMGECVHCGLNRRRNTTVLLASDVTGEVRPVGKTCLTEYTGSKIRVEALAALTGLRERFAQEVGGVLTAEDTSAPTVVIVALALRYIDLDGRYIKTQDHGPRETPTADRVRAALFHDESCGLRRPEVLASDLTDADKAAAAADIELVMTENSDSGYILNLQEVAQYDWAQITGRRNRVGLLASLPTAARRIRERVAKEAAKAAQPERPNAWIGEPKQRRDFVGTVAVARYVEVTDYSPYGSGTMMAEMLVIDTAEGTIKVVGSITWKCGEPGELADIVGKQIDLTGTIKPKYAHGEYRGVKQTSLNRVRVEKVG